MAGREKPVRAWILFGVAYIVIHVVLDVTAFSYLGARYPDGGAPFPVELVFVVNVVVAALLANAIVRVVDRRLRGSADTPT